MSRIDDLIAQHCPNGVEFAALGDVTSRGTTIDWDSVGGRPLQYIELTSVDRVTHRLGSTTTITASDAPSRARQRVRAGDILFATTRPTQMRWIIIPPAFDNQVASTGCCVLHPDPARILTNFLAHLLSTERCRRYIEDNQIRGNYPSIPDGRIRDFRVPIPPLQVQRELVHILDNFRDLEAEL